MGGIELWKSTSVKAVSEKRATRHGSATGDDSAVPIYRTRAPDQAPDPTPDRNPQHEKTVDDVLHQMYEAAGRAEPRTVGGHRDTSGSDSETTQMAPIVGSEDNIPDDNPAPEEVDLVKNNDDKYNDPMETELDAVTASTGSIDNEYAFSGTNPDVAETEYFATGTPAETDLFAAGPAGAGLAGPVVTEETIVEEVPEHRRGTTDLGLLFLRIGVGGLLILHGLATFIGFGGGPSLTQLQDQYISMGWSFAVVVAVALPAIEIIAGVLLLVGLATPLGAALALVATSFQMMTAAAENSTGWNFLDGDNGGLLQLYLILTIAALAIQFTGPGMYGLDFSRTWSRRPLASSWIFVIVAVGVAIGAWWLVTGSLPVAF